MRDNKPLELRAKNTIANKLSKLNLFVADPLYDVNGSDLLVIKEVNSIVKLGIVQSKGRTVKNDQGSNVQIHKNYLNENFILFLYIEKENTDSEEFLYCYFSEDIKKWKFNKDKYVLSIPINFEKNNAFIKHEYNVNKSKKILNILEYLPFNFQEYFSKISLVEKIILLWHEENIIPSIDVLKEIYYKTNFLTTSLSQDILIYYAALFRYEELENTEVDDLPENLSFDFLLNTKLQKENTYHKILNKLNCVSVNFMRFGINEWYESFSNFAIAEISIKIKSNILDGIYCFISNSEGKGIEMFLPKNVTFSPLIKHYKSKANKRKDEVASILIKC